MLKYDRHIKQFETCRDYIHGVEDGLKVGECVVYRDYVAQYLFGAEFLGNKINNLQLVLVWRDASSNMLTTFKVSNFCSDKRSMAHDAWFTADVFQFHMGTASSDSEANKNFSNLFSEFHTIYLVGDHGPHFSCLNTFYNESKMQMKKDNHRFVFMFLSCLQCRRCRW